MQCRSRWGTHLRYIPLASEFVGNLATGLPGTRYSCAAFASRRDPADSQESVETWEPHAPKEALGCNWFMRCRCIGNISLPPLWQQSGLTHLETPNWAKFGRNCPYIIFTNLLIRYVHLSKREAIIQKVIVLEGQIQNFSIHFRIVYWCTDVIILAVKQ